MLVNSLETESTTVRGGRVVTPVKDTTKTKIRTKAIIELNLQFFIFQGFIHTSLGTVF